MIIVIDGPSGSGKSTLAQKLADDMGVPYFDTGAMYRAFCWFLLNHNVNLDDRQEVEAMLPKMNFEIKKMGSALQYTVNNEDVTDQIREERVTKNVSKVSAYPFVRKHLVTIQRKFAQKSDGIFEGRDMGTVVFPNAEVKFFLYADPNIRALRRFEQLEKKFPTKSFNQKDVLNELMKRDKYDSSRAHSPLKQAEDAFLIDVSYLSVEKVFEIMKARIKEKL